ncbi:hypothetical protein TIFTF001_017482 [Ficus carica]|uniref:Uncharacterized protein n=1 Tax=Ficus carica TaxID=3494 RepID=A0AA88A9K8_FICCA|nr:hypothetical protein TIFTF001_017482 [Ficus carica]
MPINTVGGAAGEEGSSLSKQSLGWLGSLGRGGAGYSRRGAVLIGGSSGGLGAGSSHQWGCGGGLSPRLGREGLGYGEDWQRNSEDDDHPLGREGRGSTSSGRGG